MIHSTICHIVDYHQQQHQRESLLFFFFLPLGVTRHHSSAAEAASAGVYPGDCNSVTVDFSLLYTHTHRHKQTFRQYELNISNGRRENAFSVDDEENDDDDVDVGIITTVKVVELSGRKKTKKRQSGKRGRGWRRVRLLVVFAVCRQRQWRKEAAAHHTPNHFRRDNLFH